MSERLNLYVGIFRFLGVFVPPAPHRQKLKILSSTKSNDHGFQRFLKIWLKSVAQILRNFAEKKEKQTKNKIDFSKEKQGDFECYLNDLELI